MCLDSVTEQFDKPTTLIQSGWKRFNGSGRNLLFEAYQYGGTKDVPLDKWIKAEGTNIAGRGQDYKAGFHVFEDETEFGKAGGRYYAGKADKRRVYYRKVHTRGRQEGLSVVLATEIYVPSDPNAWPQ